MNRITLLLLTFILTITANAQTLISQFDWNANPLTTAVIGPNATSVSASASSTTGGVGGTNGLNAHASGATQDINMIIPGTPTFNVPGIDAQIDFQREESQATFFKRGNSLDFGMNGGNLQVFYRVGNGSGGFNTVNSGNIIAIPNDDVFRTYRFFYIPSTGVGVVQVNGVSVWTNDGPDNRDMYWTASDNMIIGLLMDGAGANETILDNMRIYSVTTTVLPVELVSFTATAQKNQVDIDWATASEINNQYFTVERSKDGITWENIAQVDGQGTTSEYHTYSIYDATPRSGISYYRLRQTDFNGKEETYKTVAVNVENSIVLSVYPNPAIDQFTLSLSEEAAITTRVIITDLAGKTVYSQEIAANSGTRISLSRGELPRGVYLVHVENVSTRLVLE